jgi:hypothetical protein
MLMPPTVLSLQQGLASLGFDPGPLGGGLGREGDRPLKVAPTGAAALAAAGRALLLAAEHGIHRFLFDARRCRNPASVISNYNFAYRSLTALHVPVAVRAAILVAPEDHSYDLVETLCLNAGYSVKLFREEAEALAWLKE